MEASSVPHFHQHSVRHLGAQRFTSCRLWRPLSYLNHLYCRVSTVEVGDVDGTKPALSQQLIGHRHVFGGDLDLV